jgi:DNA topoisomerase-1
MDTERSDSSAIEGSDILTSGTAAAERVELHYVHADEPGLSRRRSGRGFGYRDEHGRRISGRSTLARIRALAIPPAWTDVWICASEDGHIQATGRDARGRKQYRYHARWRAVRDEAKFEHLLAFGAALPLLRARIAADLGRARLSREKVVATVLRLMELTCVRVGNDCYAEENGTFGLTTLEDRHARFCSGGVSFAFKGKSGKAHRVSVRDAKLARTVRRCQDLPGQRLFQWVDDEGAQHPITSTEVNDYLRETMNGPFTAKMLRTWSATVCACQHLAEQAPRGSQRAAKQVVARCIEEVAARLGNTPSICRKSYVHPAVIEAYVAGGLGRAVRGRSRVDADASLRAEEHATMRFLSRRARAEAA